MSDDADKAGKDIEMQLERSIEAARRTTVFLPGDEKCRKCGEKNDQRNEGKGICFSCEDEINN